MISKAKIKYIRSLELKKNRTAEGLFVAEGPKVVGDLMPTMRLRYVVATESWLKANNTKISAEVEVFDVTEEELRKVSYLQTPQEVWYHNSYCRLVWHREHLLQPRYCRRLQSEGGAGYYGKHCSCEYHLYRHYQIANVASCRISCVRHPTRWRRYLCQRAE